MSLKKSAPVTGLSAGWTSKLLNRFIQGKPVGEGRVPPTRGSAAAELHSLAGS